MSSLSTTDVEGRPGAVPEGPSGPSPIPADAAVRRKRAWGCAILIVLALATPVLLLVAAYVGLYLSNERMAEEALAKARAAGDPVNVAEMNVFYFDSPQIEQATGHWLRATEIVEKASFQQAAKGMPIFDPARPLSPGEGLSAEDLAATTAFLDSHRAAIDAAHAARRAGAVARFPIEFEGGIAALLPHAQPLRDVVRLLELDLEANLAQNDVDGAVEDLLSIVAVSESLTNEPILVCQLIRIANFSIAVADLEQFLKRTDLTDEQLARLQEAFARQSFRESLQRGFRGEQWMLIHTLHSDAPTGDAHIDRMRMLPFGGADLAKGLEFWRPIIDASDEGLLQALAASRAMQAEMAQAEESQIDRLRYPVTQQLLPGVEQATLASLSAEANARLAESAVACERYRLAEGTLPSKLEDLVPECLREVPLDPMDAQPLRYVLDDQGAILYSIGRDQSDDGGLDEPAEGDLVFRLVPLQQKDAAGSAAEPVPAAAKEEGDDGANE